jgi:hypothetical protein
MPAINLPRLKIQANELIKSASNPGDFCRSYHEFLDYYADRTYRPGKVGEPQPLLRAYQVPKPVSRAVDKELGKWADNNRAEALNLADALWSQPYLEFRVTAAHLLGQVSPQPVNSIFSRVETWVQENTEQRLVSELVNAGLSRILTECQDEYVSQLDTWLRSDESAKLRLGLKSCPPLIARREFEDYPLIFKQLNRLMRSENRSLRGDLLIVLEKIAARAPRETEFFLEQTMNSTGDNTQIAWYARKSLNSFPPELRANLRNIVLSIK